MLTRQIPCRPWACAATVGLAVIAFAVPLASARLHFDCRMIAKNKIDFEAFLRAYVGPRK